MIYKGYISGVWISAVSMSGLRSTHFLRCVGSDLDHDLRPLLRLAASAFSTRRGQELGRLGDWALPSPRKLLHSDDIALVSTNRHLLRSGQDSNGAHFESGVLKRLTIPLGTELHDFWQPTEMDCKRDRASLMHAAITSRQPFVAVIVKY